MHLECQVLSNISSLWLIATEIGIVPRRSHAKLCASIDVETPQLQKIEEHHRHRASCPPILEALAQKICHSLGQGSLGCFFERKCMLKACAEKRSYLVT